MLRADMLGSEAGCALLGNKSSCSMRDLDQLSSHQLLKHFFFNSHSGGWSPNWVHSARRPLNGLLYLPRVIMMMENLVE
jgi:hypothetical protein